MTTAAPDKPRHIRLDDRSVADGAVRCLSDQIALAEGTKTSVVTVLRVGTFHDPRYDTFEVTREKLLSMIRNFEAGVYGQDIAVDVSHRPQDGAAGYIRKLFLDGTKLRAEIEWTDYGIEAVTKRGMRYMSAEFHEDYIDNEERKHHGPTLLGAAVTPRPVIKRMDPIQLSEESGGGPRVLVSDRVIRILSEELADTMNKYLDNLKKQLAALGLSEDLVKQLCEAFTQAATPLTEDAAIKALAEQFEASGKKVADAVKSGQGGPITLSIDGGGQPGLTEADVVKLMEKQREADAEKTRKLTETQDARRKQFSELLDADEGYKKLSEEQRKELADPMLEAITGETTEAMVKVLADQILRTAEQLSVARQLAALGHGPAGSVQISPQDADGVIKLQGVVHEHLQQSSEYRLGKIKLTEKLNPFVEKVLAEFDRLNARRLHEESVMLAGGATTISDTNLPVGFQREVIREALSDLRVLELVQALTDPAAQATTQIPYEQRDVAAVYNQGVVYEGQAIHEAGVTQAMDTAYMLAMKIAMNVTNEVMHFSRASGINWDAWARNLATNARYMRELVVLRICNEMQRSADAYLAASISAEAFTPNGATTLFKTAQFPIVRPHQQKDLQGNNVGTAENPITVTLNTVAIAEYDGTGTQSAGTYYRVTNYNLGYIQFVNETGVLQTPATNAGTNTFDYDYATNILKFDMDVPGTTTKAKHMNGLLQAVGSRKAVMRSDRFVEPDFLLMSPVLNNDATDAENFTASMKRDGASTTPDGDLERIKGVGAWSTNAPGVDLGDERILLGQAGNLSYVVGKPYMAGEPVEAVDANGKLIGKKKAYGEEYSAIKVPTPIRNRFTSVIAYSVTGR